MRADLHDDDTLTQETTHVIFRRGTDGGGPGTTVGAQLATIGPLWTPPGGGGQSSWLSTHSFANAVAVPCDLNWSFGLSLALAVGWPNDGLDVGYSRGEGANALFLQGAYIPAAGNHDHAWQIYQGGTVSHPWGHLSWNFYAISSDGAMLQMGNETGAVGDTYGQGGMYPANNNVTRGLSARCSFPASVAGGTAFLFLGTGRRFGGIAVVPGTARLRLRGVIIGLGSALIGAYNAAPVLGGSFPGAVSKPAVLSIVPAATLGMVFHVQAMGVQGTTVKLTNLATVRF